MSTRRDDPDLIRIVVGKRGKVSDANGVDHALRLWFDRSVGTTITRRVASNCRARQLVFSDAGGTLGESIFIRLANSVEAGQRVPFTLTWCPSHRRRHSIMPADRGIGANRTLAAAVVRTAARIKGRGAKPSSAR